MNSDQITLTIERREQPWRDIMQRPEVRERVGEFDVGAVVAHPQVVPIWCGEGGFLFHALDHLKLVYDMHAMFAGDVWGKHVSEGLKRSLMVIFEAGAQVITVSETQENPKSRPPLSFGFRCVGEFRDTPIGKARSWILTQDAWRASPVFKKGIPCLLP